MEDRWFGNAFQVFEATDENDLEDAMVVLRGGTHIEKDEEEVVGPAHILEHVYCKHFTRSEGCPDLTVFHYIIKYHMSMKTYYEISYVNENIL